MDVASGFLCLEVSYSSREGGLGETMARRCAGSKAGGFQNIASRCSLGHIFGILGFLFLTSFLMIFNGFSGLIGPPAGEFF